jgi:REP element-mobilizing transposase RayT
MPRTIGYHIVKSGYGLWLPGDDRGSWSEAWDVQIGYFEPHMLHPGDPVRKIMAEARMKHPPVRFTPQMIAAIAGAIGQCAGESPWRVAAASIVSTHFHLLITYSGLDIDATIKWLSQRMTKSVHKNTDHRGPVFCEGKWRGFIFNESHWRNTIRYVEQHNLRDGLPARPYEWIASVPL